MTDFCYCDGRHLWGEDHVCVRCEKPFAYTSAQPVCTIPVSRPSSAGAADE